MSDDVLANDSGHSHAKRQLAGELRKYVVIQAAILLVIAPGYVSVALNLPGWDIPGTIIFLFGSLVSGFVAYSGYYSLVHAVFLPISVRIYAFCNGVLCLSFLPIVISLPVSETIAFASLYAVPLCCGFLPQFFIARWLAKEAKDGTIRNVEE